MIGVVIALVFCGLTLIRVVPFKRVVLFSDVRAFKAFSEKQKPEEVEGLDLVAVEGKDKPVAIYRVSSLEKEGERLIVECVEKEAVKTMEK